MAYDMKNGRTDKQQGVCLICQAIVAVWSQSGKLYRHKNYVAHAKCAGSGTKHWRPMNESR